MYVCIVFRGRSKRDVIFFDVSRIHRELWRSKEKDLEGPMIYVTALGVVISHSNSNAPLLDGVACGGSARLLPWGGFEVNGLLPRGLPVARLLGGPLASPGGSAPLLLSPVGHWKQVVVGDSIICILAGGAGGGVFIARVFFCSSPCGSSRRRSL